MFPLVLEAAIKSWRERGLLMWGATARAQIVGTERRNGGRYGGWRALVNYRFADAHGDEIAARYELSREFFAGAASPDIDVQALWADPIVFYDPANPQRNMLYSRDSLLRVA